MGTCNETVIVVDSYYGGYIYFRRRNDYNYEPKCNRVSFRQSEDDAIEVLVNGRLVAIVPTEMTGEDAILARGGD